jgi:aspartyl-tRNA(Asn)/glutamyl-tRNA(Gln) amidotransferase subunit C
MAKLTPQDVLKLAQLVRLTLTEEELHKYSAELTRTLRFLEQLDSVDVSGVEPTAQVTGLVNVMRKDEIVDYGPTPEELLKNAPDRQENYIKVKRVIE